MSRRTLRCALFVTSVLAVLCGATPALAAPETAVRTEAEETVEAAELQQQLKSFRRTLVTINRRADLRSRQIAGEKVRLAQYGYTGDPDLVRAVLPMAGYHLSAGFGATGPLWESTHGGQDFGAPSGTTLVAVADGVVSEVADAGPYGLRTILTLEDGTEVWYCHQLSVMVSAGDRVEVASPLGLVGSTGNSTGPHLHLEVRPLGGSPIDPMAWLQEAGLTP